MIKLKSLIYERYGGSAKERSIWYHGTSMKRIPAIMSRGLDPNISPKNKSWGSDPNVNVINLDKTSYGGVYVSQNLTNAAAAAFRTTRIDKANEAIVILLLQPRSLVADEDDIASRIMHLKSHLAGSVYHSIYPYMWETYGARDYHKEYAEKSKKEWVDTAMASLFFELKEYDSRLRTEVRRLLYNEGYQAMLTRTVSYLKKSESHTDYWEWRKAYADVHGLKDYGDEVDIPDPPSSSEGEQEFRKFVEKLTRTLKHKARHMFTGSYSKTARSLEPITFHGSNRIIAIVELIRAETQKYNEPIRIIYGELPEDFKQQWKERVGELTIVP